MNISVDVWKQLTETIIS